MFKKRLKGLLAMVLAGSIALTALPMSASATLGGTITDGTITIVDGLNQIATIDPSEITSSGFSSGYLYEHPDYLNDNNMWAVASYNVTQGLGSGSVFATVSGNNLAGKLNEYEKESDTTYYGTYIKYSHNYVVTTEDPETTNTDTNNALTATTFPVNVSSPNPLQSITGFTVWYGIMNNGMVASGDVVAANVTETLLGPVDSIPIQMSTFEDLYSADIQDGNSWEIFFNGVTLIQVDTAYKTLNIPVLNGLGEPEMTDDEKPYTLSVTGDCYDDLDDDQNWYYVGYTKQNGEVVLSDYEVNNKIAAWAEIEEFAENDPNFDVNTLFFLRTVYVHVNKDSSEIGSFTSKDLYQSLATNDPENLPDAYKYIVKADANSIWRTDTPQKYVLGKDLLKGIETYLDNNSSVFGIYLRETTEIMVTGTEPVKDGSTKSYARSPLFVETVPATISDHAAVLAKSVAPEAGNIYDTSNWQLWGSEFEYADVGEKKPICNFYKSALESTNGVTSIGIDQLNTVPLGYSPLIYFPQIAIAPAVKVTEPVVGIAPSTGATIKDTIGGYIVTSVSWSCGDTPLTSADMFEAGKQYTVTVTLEPKDDLSFTNTTAVTINSETAEVTLADGILTAEITFDTPLNSITNAEIFIDEPALNGVPDTTFDKHTDAPFTASAATWSPADEKFEAGEEYTVTATLTPDEGYGFTNNTVFKINGETVTPDVNDDGTFTVSYTFGEIRLTEITSAALTVTAPKLGETPNKTTTPETGANYTASAVTWSPAADKFAADKKYEASVTLTPKFGYKFTANTTAKINGNTAAVTVNNDGSATVSYTFDELKANPWLDIENKLDDTLNGENPTITVPSDNPTIPKSVLEKILNGTKPVIIKFEPDNGISWEILPDNFNLSKIPDEGIDLSVIKDNSEWATVVNNITGETIKMQIRISHKGPFGFTANLVVDLTQLMQSDKIDQNGKYYANLYLVPDKDNSDIEPEWKGSDELTKQDGKWIAKLKFTHASDWLITIDDKDKDPSKNNNNGGSGSSGGGSSRPSGSSTTTESSTPMFGGKAMSWGDILAELEKLPIGSEVTIELNGITNVPFEVINVIGERKLKTTFKFDSVRSWKLNGAEITAPAAADLSIIAINRLKTDSLRGISGYQFTMNDTNIPTGIEIAFKTEYAGQFANLYKVVDGKLTFVTCAKVGADGKVILPGVADQGDYVVMLSELSDVLGDMNNDGVLDQKDASAILKDIVGLEQGKNPLMADFNGDGAIDQKDASAILKSIVGLA